jgi:hypothetical protein
VNSLPARLALLALVAGSCVGPNHQIIEDRFDISESASTPEITDITDVGGGDVPLSGTLPMQAADGVAVVGETLWIRGRSFGRQPTVVVGGRPAAVLGRTRDGGIAVRVPPLVPSGSAAVAVSNEVGRGERPIAIRRYAAIFSPGSGQVSWAEVGADGPIAAGATAVPGAKFVAMSPDGRAAYFASAAGSALDVVEIPAPGGPKQAYRLDLGGGAVQAMAVATRAPVLAVVRQQDVLLVDTTSPLRPARSVPRALPKEVAMGKIVAADVSPDGKLLALAMESDNQVVLLDLGPRGRAPALGTIPILPEVRASVLVDVAFSPVGDTLWVVSGDTPRSRAIGPQPTEVRAIRLTGSAESLAQLKVARVVNVEGATEPARLGVGRARPMVSGAAIRLPPERATVFLAASTSTSTSTSTSAPASADEKIVTATGGVFRVGAEDAASVVITAPGRMGQPDLSPDGRWLMAPAAGADGSIRVLAVVVDGRPATGGLTRAIDLAGAGAGELPAAERPVPVLRIQP